MNGVPELTDGTILLRAWRDQDLSTVEVPNHAPHFMPPGAAPTHESATEWLSRRRERMAQGEAIHWCVTCDGTPVGDVVLMLANQFPETAELGYQLWPSARGRGIGTPAARLVADYAQRPLADGGLGFRRLVAFTAGDNHASNRVLERIGFTQCGTEPQLDRLPDGTYVDGLRWARIVG